MAASRKPVTIVFKEPPMRLFGTDDKTCAMPATRCASTSPTGRDRDGVPRQAAGTGDGVEEAELDFAVGGDEREELLAPYERLFHDALVGDQTLFTRADGVERIWEVAEPLLANPPRPEAYARGSWDRRRRSELTGEPGMGAVRAQLVS